MLYLVRHGETVWNAARRYQGAMDSPLTARGRRQAEAIGRLLAELLGPASDPLRAYVSPLGRARETAEIIAGEVRLEAVVDPRIAEVSLGAWDGLTDYEIEIEFPGARDGADRFNWYFRSPDGEKLDSAIQRVSHWLSDARRPAVVISHGLIGRVIRGVFLGLSEQEMLKQAVPQDGLYVLGDGRSEFVASAAEEGGIVA